MPGDANLAVTLRSVSIAAAEERPFDLNGKIERGAAGELAGVHVPAERSRRHDRLLFCTYRADAHRPEERLDRNRNVVSETRELTVGQVEDPQVGPGEVFG